MEQWYGCLKCRLQKFGSSAKLGGTNCPECKELMSPIEKSQAAVKTDRENLKIKFAYLEELRKLMDNHYFVADATLLERVQRVCNSIEKDLQLPET